ncbi:hypothetical protein [Nocardia wallacei]|uniref:hypothetical protein n=1 Tax=Nocardia wallacei TaxID=480035 RepID=UPI0024579069|nr:hypothetical protein [Nocardia wallacei]
MNDLRSLAALQARVYEFLERQDEATLRAIISGAAQLAVEEASHVEPARDPAKVAQELSRLPSEQRRSYLTAATLTVSELRDVAKRLGLRGYSKLAKGRLVEALTDGSADASPSIEPVSPNIEAAQIASRLREIETEDEGAAYISAQRLDRAALLAVATELHLTRVDRLSRTELEKRVLKQAIGARRKFAGLRKW